MNSGIYKIINTITKKCYVGSAKDFQKRWKRHFRDLKNQKHSSIKLQRSYNKYGKNAFICEIIEKIPYKRNIILEREQYWINKLNSKINGYNIGDASFGDILTGNPKRQEIITKRSKTLNDRIKNMTNEERKRKWGKPGKLNGMYGRHRTEEEKNHLSKIHLGNKYALGCKLSEETKEKIRKTREERGYNLSENNPFYGKHHTEETKRKLSLLRLGKRPTSCLKKVIADGIVFDAVADCAKHFGVCNATVLFRIKSKHWNWFYYNDDEAIKADMAA